MSVDARSFRLRSAKAPKAPGFPIGKPRRSLDDLAVFFDKDNSADEPIIGNRSLQTIRHSLFHAVSYA